MITFFFNLLLSGCGRVINAESGQLNSPNFPSDYGDRQDCIWVITVPAGSPITLVIQTFDVSYLTIIGGSLVLLVGQGYLKGSKTSHFIMTPYFYKTLLTWF